jgi:hemolysin activation/secretion protein
MAAIVGLGIGLGGSKTFAQEAGKKDGQPEAGAGQGGFVMPSPNRGARERGTSAEPADNERPSYLVGVFVIKYLLDHPSLPAIDDLLKTEVTLGRTDEGYVAPGGGVPEETFTIEDVSLKPPVRWTSRALYTVEKAILDAMNKAGVVGVTVSPIDTEFAAPTQGDPQWGKDLRKPGHTQVTLLVKVGLVKEIRTIAFGERIPFERRINAKEHERIRENAPILVFNPDDPERQDVLRKDELDDYVARLNRFPGRRVTTSIAPAAEPGGIALDFLINENKPWMAFFQVSNTGTENTTNWRERFGFVHNQLTNDDDILSLDYTTAGFDKSHALVASYERPLWADAIRGRVFASWNEYTASDVGLGLGQSFKGEGWSLGGELIATVFQHKDLFVDVVGGVRYQSVRVSNTTLGLSNSGKSGFFIPSIGARLERNTDTASTNASLVLDANLADAGGTSNDAINDLGRLGADKDFQVLHFDISHSFYLDRLFFGSAWNDTTPNGHATLAHELALSVRGQHAFDNRLVPNFEDVVGGLYSVRGYPESVVAGDTVIVGSAEYRLHVPQAFGYDPNPGTLFGESFRYKPQQPYGRADWDLIARGFVDAGRTINSKKQAFERDESLVGAGFGFEFLFKRNLSIRADFGWALKDVETGDKAVTSGSSRVHFVATILF